MRILCDVCEKSEASVFCPADEAALCVDCDRRVHHANNLAGKHQRFSIEYPYSKQSNLCDICKEGKALLFCQQDRAILCRDCDVSIHRTNKHTRMHTRYLLIGLKVSAAPSSSISSLESNSVDTNMNSVSSKAAVNDKSNANVMNENSNISDHLIQTIPQWQLDDYLLSSSFPVPYLLSEEVNNQQMFRMMDAELQSNLCSFTTEELGFWVPQSTLYHTQNQPTEPSFEPANQTKQHLLRKINKGLNEDCYSLVPDLLECFQVPTNFLTVPNGEKLVSKKPWFSNF